MRFVMVDRRSSSEVKERMLAGIRWVAGARVIGEVSLLASSVVLARLIAPAEFGRAVIALLIANIASVLASHAFATLLIQQNEITDDDVRAAVALNVGIGLVLTVMVFALADPLSAATGGGQTGLIRAMSPACLLAGLNAVPSAMLQRQLDFRRLSMIGVASLITQAVVSVALAIAGAGAAAIVAGALSAQVVSTVASLLAYRLPRPRLRPGPARRLTKFGAPTALSTLVFTGFQNVDYAVIGARLNTTQLAFYYRAFQYGVDYQRKVSQILADMAFPVFSRLEDRHEVRLVRARMVRVHVAVIFPLLATYAALAPTLVPWLLGERWSPVVVPSQYLTVAGAVTTVLTGAGALLVALGRPGLVLGWNVLHLCCYGVMVYFVAPHGIVSVAQAVAIFYVIQGVLAQGFLVRRVAAIPLRDVFGELVGACTSCIALVVCAAGLRALLADAGIGPVFTLVVAGGAGLAAYALCLRYIFSAVWADLSLLLNRLVRTRATAAEPDVAPAVSPTESAPTAGTTAGWPR
jgi:O-antigen/teichoic acid export membrane protein